MARRIDNQDATNEDLDSTAVQPKPVGSVPKVASDQDSASSNSLTRGFTAMREVRQVSKMRADAHGNLREIENGLEQDRAELAHREDIESNFDDIVATQSAREAEAKNEINRLTAKIKEEKRNIDAQNEELRLMRDANEQTLRPYRNLMDSSRGRSDDAAKALAGARRNCKTAEKAMQEAVKTRDVHIAAAHRDVDNAQERLSSVQAQYEDTEARGDTVALAHVEDELASEAARLETVRAEVERVTRQEQANVDQIQRNLLKRQRDLQSAERTAEAAKEEANARKTEYDNLYKEAQNKERAQEDKIKDLEDNVKNLQRQRKEAEQRMFEAQDILDEAYEIHGHPEVTEGLRQRIFDEERDLDEAQVALSELKNQEKSLRRETRGTRLGFILAVAAVLIIVALLVNFLVINPPKPTQSEKAPSSETQSQVDDTQTSTQDNSDTTKDGDTATTYGQKDTDTTESSLRGPVSQTETDAQTGAGVRTDSRAEVSETETTEPKASEEESVSPRQTEETTQTEIPSHKTGVATDEKTNTSSMLSAERAG